MVDLVSDGEFHLVRGGHGPWFSHTDEIGPLLTRFLAAHRPPNGGGRNRVTRTGKEIRTS